MSGMTRYDCMTTTYSDESDNTHDNYEHDYDDGNDGEHEYNNDDDDDDNDADANTSIASVAPCRFWTVQPQPWRPSPSYSNPLVLSTGREQSAAKQPRGPRPLS